jgi:hypothetical protein
MTEDQPGRQEHAGGAAGEKAQAGTGQEHAGGAAGEKASAGTPRAAPQRFLAEFRDAVSVRTITLIAGVLLLQLGFILSYVGAFHSPKPHRIPIAVVAPQQVSARAIAQLNAVAATPLDATAANSAQQATQRIKDGSIPAALIVNPSASTDTLLVASAAGTSEATAVEQVITAIEAHQHRTAAVTDVVPLQSGDGRGLTGFYLVIGWIVGGYLVAALLGVSGGARPATTRRACIRLLAMAPYAIVSGLGGAIVVGPVLGALTGHFLALWWLGALLVLAAATVTMAFQVLFGVLGIGVTVLVFVILGNPSAGGAYQAGLLPAFWRAIGNALPNGAGTDSVRRIVYFGGHGITGHLILIAGYAAAGAIVAVAGSLLNDRRKQPTDGGVLV